MRTGDGRTQIFQDLATRTSTKPAAEPGQAVRHHSIARWLAEGLDVATRMSVALGKLRGERNFLTAMLYVHQRPGQKSVGEKGLFIADNAQFVFDAAFDGFE